MTSEQSQTGGDKSVNIQGEDITLNLGVNYSEARQIALDVFDANFYRLSQVAADTAKQRANDVIDDFLNKLHERNPAAIENTKDPDVQYAIFTAQREYARSGDKNLSDILVDILVDRVSQPNRSILQIVLNEALVIAPKLTPDQFDVLSLVFLLRYTRRLNLQSLEDFHQYVKTDILPISRGIKAHEASFQHLEYTGCGTQQITSVSIERIFLQSYPGLFWRGATKEDVDKLMESTGVFQEIFRPCIQNPTLFQFNALNEDTIRDQCKTHGFPEEKIPALLSFQQNHLLGESEIKDIIVAGNEEYKSLDQEWTNSSIKGFTLTSVGIAIAHANIRRKLNEQFDLNIWIN